MADRLLAGVGHSGVHRDRHSEQSRGRGYGIDLDAIAAALWGLHASALGYLGGASFENNLWLPMLIGAGASLLVGGIGELVRRKVLDQGTEDEGRGRGARSTDAAPGGGTASAPVCGSAGASRDWRGRGRRGHTHPAPLYRLISGRSARDDRDSSGGGDPAVVLVDVARDVGADLLILGRRGGDFVTRTMLGSVAQRVVEQAPCDALVLG